MREGIFMSKAIDPYSLKNIENKKAFKEGMHDGIPIGLGYLAVSFSLGIMARKAGLTPFQSFLTSLFVNASAGEYAGFTLIAAGATFLEMAIMILIANARYLLMSLAMSQRVKEDIRWYHRFLMAFDITDELFAIAIAKEGYLNPNYTYGAVIVAAPFWAIGTALGCIAGNLMPLRLVSAFSVALFGMFLAVIIPPAKQDKMIAGLILVSFISSFLVSYLPLFNDLSDGTQTIVLTVVISAMAAYLFPHKEERKDE